MKIGEPELQRLYEFDLSVVDDLAQVEAAIAALPAPGGDDPAPTLDRLLQELRALDGKWRQREQVISNVLQGAPGAPPAGA